MSPQISAISPIPGPCPPFLLRVILSRALANFSCWDRPKILGFPYNISAMAGASDFKFGAQLGFAKAHHKITRRRKGGRGPGLVELSKILWFHLNIYTMAEARDFKYRTQLWFAKAHHKTTPTVKVGLALG